MAKDDTSLVRLGDIATAVALLTRLPVRAQFERGARAAWAYPLAGAIVATLAMIPSWGALAVGMPVGLAALIYVACSAILTGAMHEDGLADSADGLWGGWTPERRLEIMKDSQIGSYGVIALIGALLARGIAVMTLMETAHWIPALIVVAVLSRAAMPVLMTALPHARDVGLSQSQGRPGPATSCIAVGIGALAAVGIFGLWGLVFVGVVAGMTIATGLIAKAKINGQTGDILGATQQMAEIALLAVLSTQI